MARVFKNKKGIELSINFIVGLILGIILLSLGLAFTIKMFKGTDDLGKGFLPDGMDIEADNCIQRNDKVCIPFINRDTLPEQTVSFGVVINNIYGKKAKFRVITEFKGAILDNEVELDDIELEKWTLQDEGVVLENNDNYIAEVPIRPPSRTKAGTYVFNVFVCFDSTEAVSNKCPSGTSSLYSPIQQVTVEVS